MAYTVPWNEATPDGSEDADTLDTEIQNLKRSLRERLEDFFPDWSDDGVDPKIPVTGYPRCSLILQSQQTGIITATYTPIAFGAGSEEFDDGAMHDVSTNNSRITIPAGLGGDYMFSANVIWAVVGTGTYREISFYKNGVIIDEARVRVGATSGDLAAPTCQNLTWLATLVPTDFIELRVVHDVGSDSLVNKAKFAAVRLA
jgi:hypothetical protein